MTGDRRAAFLDRDGTIVRDVDHLRRPEDIELLPGAADAIATLNGAGIAVVVVTNQSGIARQFLTEEQYRAVQRRLDEMLAERGARIDASYHCPHFPDITGPCECRKPGVALFERAIADLALDPTRSLFAGDRWRDVAAAEVLGGRGYLIPSPSTPPEDKARAGGRIRILGTIAEAIADAFDLPASGGAA